jgi:hypothetical protein
MKVGHFFAFALLGWYLIVAPMPKGLEKFDTGAPMTRWEVMSHKFRSERDCEIFRNHAARSGLTYERAVGQFSAPALARAVPKQASRCVDAGDPPDVPPL